MLLLAGERNVDVRWAILSKKADQKTKTTAHRLIAGWHNTELFKAAPQNIRLEIPPRIRTDQDGHQAWRLQNSGPKQFTRADPEVIVTISLHSHRQPGNCNSGQNAAWIWHFAIVHVFDHQGSWAAPKASEATRKCSPRTVTRPRVAISCEMVSRKLSSEIAPKS